MNQEILADDKTQAVAWSELSAGQMLRQAREAQGLHIAALAASMKVPVKKLEALEQDRVAELSDTVFVRALASSVCRSLKMDAAPILEKLPQLNTRVLDQTENGMNVPFRTRTDSPSASSLTGLNKTAVFGVLALLLAALVIMLLPEFKSKMDTQANSVVSSHANSSVLAQGQQVSEVKDGLGSVSAAISPNTPPFLTGLNSHSPISVGSVATPTSITTVAVSTPTVNSPTLVPDNSIIVFTATGESWVEVRDVNKKIMLQKILKTGDKAGATGALPLSIVIGRANNIGASVRGKDFDLKPHSSKDLVARFQVK